MFLYSSGVETKSRIKLSNILKLTINSISFSVETAIQCEAKYKTFSRMQLVLVLVFVAVPCLSRKPSPEGENIHVVINSFFA